MRDVTWSLVLPKTVERSEMPVGYSLGSPLSLKKFEDFDLLMVVS